MSRDFFAGQVERVFHNSRNLPSANCGFCRVSYLSWTIIQSSLKTMTGAMMMAVRRNRKSLLQNILRFMFW